MIGRQRAVRVGALALLVSLAACGPLSLAERREIDRAERRWLVRPFENYVFEIARGGFPPDPFEWVEVTVRARRVVAVRVAGADTLLPNRYWSGYGPIDSMFVGLRLMDRKFCGDLDIAFDRTLGYPTSRVCAAPKYQDGWGGDSIRSVRALP